MQLLSVNIGTEKPIANGKRTGTSGIFKVPISEPVTIGVLGLAGDAVIDTDNHGGVDQAVYVYGQPDYDWWNEELGTTLPPGTFGENLTISGFSSAEAHVGDRFRLGDVVLEITDPRIPCATLNARMQDPHFVKRFRAAERPGVYCRVVIPGKVQVGNTVTHIATVAPTVSIIEAFRFFYEPERHDIATVRRFLAAPVSIRARTDLLAEYARLTERPAPR